MATKWTVDPRLWDDEKFSQLEDGPQLVWLCLLTGPLRTSLPGLIRASAHSIAEVRRRPVGHVQACLNRLQELGMIRRDDRARLIQVPKAPRYAPRPNGSTLKSWFFRWEELPESHLKYDHIDCLEEGLGLREVMTYLRSQPSWVTPPPPWSQGGGGGVEGQNGLTPPGGYYPPGGVNQVVAYWVGGFERARSLREISLSLTMPASSIPIPIQRSNLIRSGSGSSESDWVQKDLPYDSSETKTTYDPILGPGPRWSPQDPVASMVCLPASATNVVDLITRLPRHAVVSEARNAKSENGGEHPRSESSAPSPRREPRPNVPIPPDLNLDDSIITWCKNHEYPGWWVRNRFEHFRNVAAAYGWRRADWRKAFMVWLTNEYSVNGPDRIKRPYKKKEGNGGPADAGASPEKLERVRRAFAARQERDDAPGPTDPEAAEAE